MFLLVYNIFFFFFFSTLIYLLFFFRFVFFFFKQKTAYYIRISDWSSDVCSSDLILDHAAFRDAVARPVLRQIGLERLVAGIGLGREGARRDEGGETTPLFEQQRRIRLRHRLRNARHAAEDRKSVVEGQSVSGGGDVGGRGGIKKKKKKKKE